MSVRKKDSTAILNALSGGVVPGRGLQHIMVGRADEARQIRTDLESVAAGTSIVKFFVGPFGCGKTFLQAFTQQIAFSLQFVAAKADFNPERRLHAGDGKAVALYTELMTNLSTSTMPEGNALPTILEKWIADVQTRVMTEKEYSGVRFDDPDFVRDVESEIMQSVVCIEELKGGFDFGYVLTKYFRGFVEDRSDVQRACLKWLRGEYTTKMEARQDLGVREIINDDNYYDYLKVMARFVRDIGYSGLVVNFDEAINLYKITHSVSREKNYEAILRMFNDIVQGTLEGLYISFGGTPEFLEDERRGLFSYGALKRRLEPNRFETSEHRDLTQPVVKLTPLGHEETYLLLQKLRDIHATHHDYEANVTDAEMLGFIQSLYARPGATNNLTVGDVIREFLHALSILHQNPEYDRTKIFTEPSQTNPSNDDRRGRFQRLEV